jgi:hypothetical protein
MHRPFPFFKETAAARHANIALSVCAMLGRYLGRYLGRIPTAVTDAVEAIPFHLRSLPKSGPLRTVVRDTTFSLLDQISPITIVAGLDDDPPVARFESPGLAFGQILAIKKDTCRFFIGGNAEDVRCMLAGELDGKLRATIHLHCSSFGLGMTFRMP